MLQLDMTNSEGGLPAWLGAIVGVGVGVVYGLFGFFLLRMHESPHMGEALFVILPLVVGATIAVVTPRPITAIAILAGSISLLICLGLLISLRAEGILCAILAFPIIFVSLLLGVVIGVVIRRVIGPFRTSTNAVVVLIGPLLIFGGHYLEMNAASARTQSVTTTMLLSAPPEDVWSNIQSLDSLAGEKPLLMHFGLPIPQKCVLQGKAPGSKRICYFDQGFIEETILEWDPPQHMRLSIDRSNMPGRHWLDFEGAEYDLKKAADGTEITRTTTIRSKLSPAWYWGRLESWGVQSEHKYLFSDLAKRFANNEGN